MNIVLFGMKACGKTAAGKALKALTGKAFFDTDKLISEIYGFSGEKNLEPRDIYVKIGPKGFRTLEKEAVLSLQDVRNSIISVGGGTMLDPESVEMLKAFGNLVYLKIDQLKLKERIFSSSDLPSFFDPKDPEGSFDAMYDQRNRQFSKIPAIVVDVTNLSPEEIASKVHEECSKDGK